MQAGICFELCMPRYWQPIITPLSGTLKNTFFTLPHHCPCSALSLQAFAKLCSPFVGSAWEEPGAPIAFIQSLAGVPTRLWFLLSPLACPCTFLRHADSAAGCIPPDCLFLAEEGNRPLEEGPGTSACNSFGMNPNASKAFSRGNRSRFQLARTIISDDLGKKAFVLPSDIKDGDRGSRGVTPL